MKTNTIIQIGNLKYDRESFSNPQEGRVYSQKGICPCIDCMGGGVTSNLK